MIILDGVDDPGIKANNAHLDPEDPPVARATTPSPSLPDYEASQAQLNKHPPTPIPPRKKRRRLWRFALYGLLIYFLLTITIGIPILVTKLHHGHSYNAYATDLLSTWQGKITPYLQEAATDAPLLLSAATTCNNWSTQDTPLAGGSLGATLQYTLPADGSVFVRSNVSSYNSTTDTMTVLVVNGTINVDVNDDPSATDALVSVSMVYPNAYVKNNTNVCLMSTVSGNGLYIFTPPNLSYPGYLQFNISLLLPQNGTSIMHIPRLVVGLPHFTQKLGPLAKYIDFDEVLMSGPVSSVAVDSVRADIISVKTSLAEIQGTFNASQSLVLETMSAPIKANVSLHNEIGYKFPTFMRLVTGNAPINASVGLFVLRSEPNSIANSDFHAGVNTFNGPVALSVAHLARSQPSVLYLDVNNNVAPSTVALDALFEGTFDVHTTFAQALVAGAMAGRALDYDVLSDARMTGWIGNGTRPQDPLNTGQGHVSVGSSLANVSLSFGT